MDGNGTSVAGAQFVEPLAAVALDRLVVGDPLREQESLDAVDVFDPLGDQRRTLAAQASSILLLGRGRDGHGADARLTALEREQRAQQRLSVEPVGFGVAPTPRRGDRRRIDHVALDAFSLQQAMQPEAVEPRLLDSDDREGVSGASLSLALEFGKAQQQRRHVAGGHAVLRHFLARPRRQRCDEPDFAAQLQRDENRGNVGLDGGRNFGTVGCFRHFPLLSGSFDNPTLPERRSPSNPAHGIDKPEHAVDLDTGVVVAAPIHPADEGDATTLSPTLEAAARNLDTVGLAPSEEEPCVPVADKGYHAREQLKALDGGMWKTRIAEPEPARGYLRWHGDEAARRAVYANRARLKSTIGRETMRRRGELVERAFAHILDRGGMRRAWLRGRENIHKRYLIHVAGFNLGLLMRALYGKGTPKEAAEARNAIVLVLRTDTAMTFALIAVIDGEPAALVIAIATHTN